MPLVRIAVPSGVSEAHIQSLVNGVHQAMVEALRIPQDDQFCLVTQHPPGHLRANARYMGIDRSAAAVIVEILMKSGRTPDMKRHLYRAIAERLSDAPGLRPQDLMVVLRENEPVDWSFGLGEAQLAPA